MLLFNTHTYGSNRGLMTNGLRNKKRWNNFEVFITFRRSVVNETLTFLGGHSFIIYINSEVSVTGHYKRTKINSLFVTSLLLFCKVTSVVLRHLVWCPWIRISRHKTSGFVNHRPWRRHTKDDVKNENFTGKYRRIR